MMSSFGIPIISAPKDEGVVILSSWDHRDFLLKESNNYLGGVRVVDPYKYLLEKGYDCHMPLYELEPLPEEYDVGFPLEEFARYE